MVWTEKMKKRVTTFEGTYNGRFWQIVKEWEEKYGTTWSWTAGLRGTGLGISKAQCESRIQDCFDRHFERLEKET